MCKMLARIDFRDAFGYRRLIWNMTGWHSTTQYQRRSRGAKTKQAGLKFHRLSQAWNFEEFGSLEKVDSAQVIARAGIQNAFSLIVQSQSGYRICNQ
jgi:hypothetical protein